MRKGILWSVILAGVASLLVAAQTPHLEFVGQLGGTASAVETAGTMIVLGEGPRLVTVDASDPSQLVELGRSAPLPNHVADLSVHGDIVYVAADLHGVFVFSLQDPANPVVIGSLRPQDSAVAVCAIGDLLLVADRDAGLSVIDVSNPSSPELVGSFDTPGQTLDVVAAGTIAYVADMYSGLRVLSIADPTHPKELAVIESLEGAGSLCIQGDVLYVFDQHSKFHSVSIADPEHPVLLASLHIKYPVNGIVIGEYAYVSTNYYGTRIISIVDPAHPVDMGRLAGSAAAFAPMEGLLCVAEGSLGLHVYALDDPAQPQEVGVLDSAFYATHVVVADHLAYVSDLLEGIDAISVADPQMPQLIGTLPLPEATNFDLEGDWLVVCTIEGLVIVDTADPSHLVESGRVAFPSSPCGVDVVGDIAYVICEFDGLQIVSLADPTHPQIVASMPVDGYGADVVIRGDLAYIAASGLHVASIADPLFPELLGSLPSDQLARSLVLVDDVVWFSEGSLLRMISVSDPSHPVEVGRKTMGLGAAVAITGDLAIIGLEWVGVRMFDLADLTSLSALSTHDTGDRANDVVIVDDLVYVADEQGGLVVLRLFGGSTP